MLRIAFFVLREDRGCDRDAGLELAWSQGGGAAVTVPQVDTGHFDAGYGDICALIEQIAKGKINEGPVAIYTVLAQTPLTIAVDAYGPIKCPMDFEGRTIIGHAQDAALLTFDLLADATGTALAKVNVVPSLGGEGKLVAAMLAGNGVHGVFGAVSTIMASIAHLRIDRRRLWFINYADHLPEMYGNTLFVTRAYRHRYRHVLACLLAELNRGLADAAAESATVIDAVVRRSPTVRCEANRASLVGTLTSEPTHLGGARVSIGDMDDGRLARLIGRIVQVKKLPRAPSVSEVFDRSFLPPNTERIGYLPRR